MLPLRSLLFSLNRCSSSIINRTLGEGSMTFRSIHTKNNRSSLCRSAQDVSIIAQYARCPTYQNVRPLSSSATSPEHPDCDPEIFQCLRDNGFPEDACKEILVKLSPLRMNQNKLNRAMSSWGACQFGHERLIYLLRENPDLLLVDHQQIMSSFTFLSSFFTQNYVYKVLLNCPQVVFEKESELSSKLDFLNKKLGVPNSEIVNSSSLGHSLECMRVRFEFLKRCGVYKVVEAGAATVNPSLSDMFDTTDEQFARQVARLTSLEFEAFFNLFSSEDDDDDNSDYDSN